MATSTTTIGTTVTASCQRNIPPFLLPTDKFTYWDLLVAYLDCRLRKRDRRSSVTFEKDYEYKLRILLDEINERKYEIGRSTTFVVMYPKPREIWAADFRDRIVHHLIYNIIGDWYEKRFIEDSFACIKGRGTLAAINRVNKFCRSITEDWTKQAYALQLDLANFFVSIDRNILWDIVSKTVGYESVLSWLIKKVILHDPTDGDVIHTTPHLQKCVPDRKSLWKTTKGYGLPIGNLTSQFLANIYNDGLDKFIKHDLKIKYYARYVDDMVLISRDKDYLYYCRDAITKWCKENRKLTVNPTKTTLKPVLHGVDFVGSYILPYRRYTRKRTVKAAFKKKDDPYSLNSYLGMMIHANSYNLRKEICCASECPSRDEYSKVLL